MPLRFAALGFAKLPRSLLFGRTGDRPSPPQKRRSKVWGGAVLLILAGLAIAFFLGGSAHKSSLGDNGHFAARLPSVPDEVRIAGMHRLFGFNEDPIPQYFPVQHELNMPVRRISIPWSSVEATRDQWTWAQFDALYSALLQAGLRPLIVAGGAPCWTHPTTPCNPAAPPLPSFDSDWFGYVKRLTSRYPAAVGIEVWNEPNVVPSFDPVDPVRYTALLKEAYTAVKGVNPRMPVISGGLFASNGSGSYGMADNQFLAAMYAAGAGGWMDAIGAHPYPISASIQYDPAAIQQPLQRLRVARDAAHQSSTPIWITEMGVSTQSANGSPPGVTEAQQAEYLVRMVHEVEVEPDVRMALIHRLVDVPPPPVQPSFGGPPVAAVSVESGFGVFRADGSPKPAACALSRVFHGSLAC